MPVPAEEIPDIDCASRLIEYPHAYNDDHQLIWGNVFQFPGGQCESLVWRKYAPTDKDVHEIGQDLWARKQAARPRPDRRYMGFMSAVVGDIRSITTHRGHSFSVEHEPAEGVHHAHVCYDQAAAEPLRPADKAELKNFLKERFSSLVPAAY